MRYFFVSYVHPRGYGNICLTGSQFPSQQFIRNQILRQMDTQQVVVLSIYEFKNQQDYEFFQQEEQEQG
jgi:hypothetical protein